MFHLAAYCIYLLFETTVSFYETWYVFTDEDKFCFLRFLMVFKIPKSYDYHLGPSERPFYTLKNHEVIYLLFLFRSWVSAIGN